LLNATSEVVSDEIDAVSLEDDAAVFDPLVARAIASDDPSPGNPCAHRLPNSSGIVQKETKPLRYTPKTVQESACVLSTPLIMRRR
jgi:hypothetical protein